MSTLCVFLRFCEAIDAVEEGLAERVPVPNVPDEEEINDERVEPDEAAQILAYLDRFEYASRRHVEFKLIWELGIRLGAVRGLNVEDYRPDERRLQLHDRPEQDMPLKNGGASERHINISTALSELIDTYLRHHHPGSIDEKGREPLFATREGRIAETTLRRDMYKLTRPCEYSQDCPHGRDVTSCSAAVNSAASECPSSLSLHPVRRGSIMHQLDQGVPKEVLSDRVDVSKPVLDKHYDLRSEQRKSTQRRDVLAEELDWYE